MLPPQLFGFELTATVTVGDAGAEGAIATLGDWSNGWALYLLGSRPVFVLTTGTTPLRLAGADPLGPGAHTLTVSYDHVRGGPSQLALAVDGTQVAQSPATERLPFRWQIGGAGLLVGAHAGFPVHEEYQPPFPFTGVIHQVVLAVPAMAPSETDVAAEIAEALHKESEGPAGTSNHRNGGQTCREPTPATSRHIEPPKRWSHVPGRRARG